MKIAVIGGGHGALAAAAEMSENGHNVRLWRRDSAALAGVRERGALTLTDYRGTREVPLALVSDDIAAAMDGADLVLLPLPCTAHEDLAQVMAGHWQNGQVAFLPPGTFGGYIFAKALHEYGNKADVSFAETGTLPYLARKQAEDHLRISVYATRLPTGVFPARNRDFALETIRRAYPAVEPLRDLLDAALMNAGPVIHPPLILMNAGPLEHFDMWDIHNEGTQPSIRRVTDALDQERIALREALGYGAPHFPLADHYDDDRDEWMYGDGSHEKLTDSGDWREKIDLVAHRYMAEDTVLGLSFWASLGRRAGIEMPLTGGMLAMASAITERDAMSEGRTLENLGLADLSDRALQSLLENGLAS
jgi:opine dehydrogenase